MYYNYDAHILHTHTLTYTLTHPHTHPHTHNTPSHTHSHTEIGGDDVTIPQCRLRRCFSSNDVTLEPLGGATSLTVDGEPVKEAIVLRQGMRANALVRGRRRIV